MLFVRSKNDLPNNFKGVYKHEKFVQGAYGFQSIYNTSIGSIGGFGTSLV